MLKQDGSDIILKISDTGDGISSRDLGNIFDRFYQVGRVNPNGSGIGLSLAKAFVELHGGSISVESTEGKGSTFTVRLPIRHVEETATESEKRISESEVEAELNPIETEAVFDDGKPVLLVVDDNSDIQKLIRELLGSGYNVITASNGKEGGQDGGQIRARPHCLRRDDARHGRVGMLQEDKDRTLHLPHPGADADGLFARRATHPGL